MKKKIYSIKTIGIVIKNKVPEANNLALEVAAYLKKRRIQIAYAEEAAQVFLNTRGIQCKTKESLIQKSDLILVLGGDGTLISVARLMKKKSIPLLGVNMGQLGFLTEIKKAELFQGLAAAISNKLPISQRTMLLCTLLRKGKTLLSQPIVNDVVVSKGAIARIFDTEVRSNRQLISHFKADGLIISSPTGSTAYALAAGGPILEPSVPALIIAPICPHSLTLRPLVLGDDSKLTVIPKFKSGSVILTLDGQTSFDLKPGDILKITRYEKHPLLLLRWPKRDYFSLLREKLKYGFRD